MEANVPPTFLGGNAGTRRRANTSGSPAATMVAVTSTKGNLNALVLIGSAVEAAAGVLRRLRCARHAIHRNL